MGLGIGKCYRLLYPKLVGQILTFGDKFRPGPIKSFSGAKLTQAILKKFQAKKVDPDTIKLISETCNVEQNTSVPLLYLKVVFVGGEKLGRYSKYRVVKVKDRSGFCHFITLYGNVRNDVECGEVYKFVALMAQKYRGEGELYGRLKSQAATRIVKAGADVCLIFKEVTMGDVVLKGEVIAHEEAHHYECCEHCQRASFKNDRGVKCIFCGEAIAEGKSFMDFSVVLLVLDHANGQVARVAIFRKDLGLPFNELKVDQISDEMIKLHNMRVTVEGDREEKSDCIRAVKILIE
jgi:hypothetical protein